jgi:hypothetical protein
MPDDVGPRAVGSFYLTIADPFAGPAVSDADELVPMLWALGGP